MARAEHRAPPALELQAGAPAPESIRLVLLDLFARLQSVERGALRGEDPEALHDYRVAVRRTRSLLGTLESVLPQAWLHPFQKEFAALGARTNPLRDLDVQAVRLGRDRMEGPGPDHLLESFAAFLAVERGRHQAAFMRVLRSRRYRIFKTQWQLQLSALPPGTEGIPTGLVAEWAIQRAFERLLTAGADLGPEAPAFRLHRIRIRGKKLRYLLEAFRSLWPAPRTEALLRALKGIQDALGDVQDLQVQGQLFRRFLSRPPQASGRDHGMAAEVLARLQAQQEAARREFEVRYREFASPGSLARLGFLFTPVREDGPDRS